MNEEQKDFDAIGKVYSNVNTDLNNKNKKQCKKGRTR